jgi:hypothetical protein
MFIAYKNQRLHKGYAKTVASRMAILCKTCGYAYGVHSGLDCDDCHSWSKLPPEFYPEKLNKNTKVL